jgi:hypothetical protein
VLGFAGAQVEDKGCEVRCRSFVSTNGGGSVGKRMSEVLPKKRRSVSMIARFKHSFPFSVKLSSMDLDTRRPGFSQIFVTVNNF